MNALSGLGLVMDAAAEGIVFGIVVVLIPAAQGKPHRRRRGAEPIFQPQKRALVEIDGAVDLGDEIEVMRRRRSPVQGNQIEDEAQAERAGQFESLALKLLFLAEVSHAHRDCQIAKSRVEIRADIHGKRIETIRPRLPAAADKDRALPQVLMGKPRHRTHRESVRNLKPPPCGQGVIRGGERARLGVAHTGGIGVYRRAVDLARIVRDKAHAKGAGRVWDFEHRACDLVVGFGDPSGMGKKRLPLVDKPEQAGVEKQRAGRVADQPCTRVCHGASPRVCGKCEKHKAALSGLHARGTDFFLIGINGFQIANRFPAEHARVLKLRVGPRAHQGECQQACPNHFACCHNCLLLRAYRITTNFSMSVSPVSGLVMCATYTPLTINWLLSFAISGHSSSPEPETWSIRVTKSP